MVDPPERDVGPRNGRGLSASSWTDRLTARACAHDATPRRSPSSASRARRHQPWALGTHPGLHHLCVCTLCSCYPPPWPCLGLPAHRVQFPSPAYRSLALSTRAGFSSDSASRCPTRYSQSPCTTHLRSPLPVVPMRPVVTELGRRPTARWSPLLQIAPACRVSVNARGPRRDMGSAQLVGEPGDAYFNSEWEPADPCSSPSRRRCLGAWSIAASRTPGMASLGGVIF